MNYFALKIALAFHQIGKFGIYMNFERNFPISPSSKLDETKEKKKQGESYSFFLLDSLKPAKRKSVEIGCRWNWREAWSKLVNKKSTASEPINSTSRTTRRQVNRCTVNLASTSTTRLLDERDEESEFVNLLAYDNRRCTTVFRCNKRVMATHHDSFCPTIRISGYQIIYLSFYLLFHAWRKPTTSAKKILRIKLDLVSLLFDRVVVSPNPRAV